MWHVICGEQQTPTAAWLGIPCKHSAASHLCGSQQHEPKRPEWHARCGAAHRPAAILPRQADAVVVNVTPQVKPVLQVIGGLQATPGHISESGQVDNSTIGITAAGAKHT